jgi:ribonuclease VapC
MVIDTSAIVAFLRSEPEADAIEELLDQEPRLRMSTFSALEARVVLGRRFGPRAVAEFEVLLVKAGVELVAFDAEQSEIAADAYRRFGKGSGHAAQLNLGNCASYALATALAEPLLFKGNDFPHTDIEPALGLTV